ncbi:uncharacterized protein LOC124267578 isoform X1 [Haliotis rubra]|uniref:uncharacterized protein LOC124267578 isoform X1 n=1 Tax=Haliotis rubra TaxID=36100 RepID=UPI001EE5A1C5|nr:uncharacterized protein LOC124267578 isoform X1 [Haliotis rubra]
MGKTTDGGGIGVTDKNNIMEEGKKDAPSEPVIQNDESNKHVDVPEKETPREEETGKSEELVDNDVGKISVEIKKSIAGDKPESINQFDSVSNDKAKEPPQVKDPENPKKPESDKIEPLKTQNSTASSKSKKPKKGIFVSYSPDAGFLERRFVVETAQQLKENNLADDLWFDKDEKNTGSPCWFSLRMEAVEKCRAAILILSDSYFTCPVSVYEGKALIDRHKTDPSSVRLFPILFNNIENSEVPKHYSGILHDAVDLTVHAKLSLAEKTSIVIGSVMEELEKFATLASPPTPLCAPDAEFTGEYRRKKICQWNVGDLQEWLFKLGIKEFYRQSLAENMVDGFLLMSLTDHDMVKYLGVDSRVVRKKIMQQILQTLDKEHKQPDNWHLRARAQRAKPDVVYVIYDPADVRLAQNIKADLRKKNLQVIHHDGLKLGRSKEEFLQINGPQIATATHVIVLMTEASTGSPFVFHEVLFADWLGKKLVTSMFKNVWTNLRVSLKAVLGECPAIDFETKMYTESLDVLEHHIKPLRRVPGVVLEQTYLNKMADGLKPLEVLAGCRTDNVNSLLGSEGDPMVFISYQWDMQSKVEEIQMYLERAGLVCWADISVNLPRGHSSRSTRSSATYTNLDTGNDTLQGQIQRTMKSSAVVLCCITPKYLQSDNCVKDLGLAENYNKPIIPLLLRFVPIETAPAQVKRLLLRQSYIDLSNERLYRQNIPLVLDKVRKVVGMM